MPARMQPPVIAITRCFPWRWLRAQSRYWPLSAQLDSTSGHAHRQARSVHHCGGRNWDHRVDVGRRCCRPATVRDLQGYLADKEVGPDPSTGFGAISRPHRQQPQAAQKLGCRGGSVPSARVGIIRGSRQ